MPLVSSKLAAAERTAVVIGHLPQIGASCHLKIAARLALLQMIVFLTGADHEVAHGRNLPVGHHRDFLGIARPAPNSRWARR